MLKLLLNVVTARIEHLSSGYKFLYASVKEVCCLWAQPHFDTFHQLLIIIEALWCQPVLQVGKQVVVTWSEIRVRRVLWNAPAVIEWEHLYMDMHCHGGALPVHWISAFHTFCSEWPYIIFLVFYNTLLTLLWCLVAWISPSALLSCPKNSCHQFSHRQTFV
jgi:hypothetical protein